MRIDITKYLGIPYKHLGRDFSGVDCLGISYLFFKTEFNVILPDPAYPEDWENDGQNLIEEGYDKICDPTDRPARYGIIGFRMPGHAVEHHLGIVMWDMDQFLHSPLNNQSCLSRLSEPIWKRSVSSFYKVRGV